MKKALRPIRRRIRLLRAAQGFFVGFLAGAAACLALTAASFFVPIEALWRYLAMGIGACALLGPAVGALLPVPLAYAARRADASGLMERARTALAFEGTEGAMYDLQRADARAHLAALPVRQALPFRLAKRIWIPAVICTLTTGALLVLPNPQHDALHARAQERQAIRAQADMVEKAAEAVSEQSLADQERRELRRLTGEMARELREAENKREALALLDEKQKQMERLQKDIRDRIVRETSQALGAQPSLKGLAEAVEAGDVGQTQEALAEIAEALQSGEQAALGEQLAQAAAAAPAGAVQEGLSAAAAAAMAGNPQLAAQALSGALGSAGSTGADLASLMRLARAGVAQAGSRNGAGQGQGDGQGQGTGQGQGQGQGGGAGMGTTQRDAGYTAGFSQSSGQAGTGAIQDRIGAYERIYDPTRLGGDNEASFVDGRIGEGESQQARLGPGMGDLSGSVPYDQVIGEYRQAAAQAMRRTPLPAAVQDWVNRYFDALID